MAVLDELPVGVVVALAIVALLFLSALGPVGGH